MLDARNSCLVWNVTQVAVKPVGTIKSVSIVLSNSRHSIGVTATRGAKKSLKLRTQCYGVILKFLQFLKPLDEVLLFASWKGVRLILKGE